ncbi:MAG: DUF481 domain-containing protein [Planctomycetota bacterium]|nr:DUF481 domain-containing protein [Planctomycetota bacterium]
MARLALIALLLTLLAPAVAWADPVDAPSLRDAIPSPEAIDAAVAAPRLERHDTTTPLGPDLWPIGGRRKADGTCCPPPPPRELREDPCTPLDPCAEPDCCASPWSTALTLGLNLAQGNTDKLDLAFAGEIKYDRKPWILRWRWLLAYGETDGTKSTDAFNSDLRAERRFGRKWSAFVSLDYNQDRIADLQYRWIGNAGAGYWFYEYKGTFLKGEIGIGHTTEKRRFRAETNALSGYLGVEHLYKFRNGIDIGTRARYFPNFEDHDLSLFVLESLLAVPLNDTFAIAVALRIDHVIDAPDPAENTDVLLTLGVQGKF